MTAYTLWICYIGMLFSNKKKKHVLTRKENERGLTQIVDIDFKAYLAVLSERFSYW